MIINDETKEKLAGIKDFSEFFSEDELNKWLDIVEDRIDEPTNFLKKVLGVAYIPTLNYITDGDKDRPYILDRIGLEDKSDKYIASLAFLLYKQEDFKSYGNEEVTEDLNYFEFESGEGLTAYWVYQDFYE